MKDTLANVLAVLCWPLGLPSWVLVLLLLATLAGGFWLLRRLARSWSEV